MANPFLTDFGTKDRPAAGRAHVVMTVAMDPKEDFPVELVTAKGESVSPHVQRDAPLLIATERGKATWYPSHGTATRFRKGTREHAAARGSLPTRA